VASEAVYKWGNGHFPLNVFGVVPTLFMMGCAVGFCSVISVCVGACYVKDGSFILTLVISVLLVDKCAIHNNLVFPISNKIINLT